MVRAQVQAICDHKRRFTYMSARTVGPTHDATAFSTTNVYDELSAGQLPHAYHFVADDAYSGSAEEVLTPYPGYNLAETALEQDVFNYYLSNARVEVECALGALVRRFGMPVAPIQHRSIKMTTMCIAACCKLHNFCIDTDAGSTHLRGRRRRCDANIDQRADRDRGGVAFALFRSNLPDTFRRGDECEMDFGPRFRDPSRQQSQRRDRLSHDLYHVRGARRHQHRNLRRRC
eukprot:SAG11_NODE_877_length_6761_cov_5.177574_4_plen_232_part_00